MSDDKKNVPVDKVDRFRESNDRTRTLDETRVPRPGPGAGSDKLRNDVLNTAPPPPPKKEK